jgi:hypothetical protein
MIRSVVLDKLADIMGGDAFSNPTYLYEGSPLFKGGTILTGRPGEVFGDSTNTI